MRCHVLHPLCFLLSTTHLCAGALCTQIVAFESSKRWFLSLLADVIAPVLAFHTSHSIHVAAPASFLQSALHVIVLRLWVVIGVCFVFRYFTPSA